MAVYARSLRLYEIMRLYGESASAHLVLVKYNATDQRLRRLLRVLCADRDRLWSVPFLIHHRTRASCARPPTRLSTKQELECRISIPSVPHLSLQHPTYTQNMC
jgi:hypothetical protein